MMLAGMQVEAALCLQVSKLELIYELPCLPDSPSVVVAEKCRLVDTCLYVAGDQANCAPPEWNRELARFFSCTATGAPRPATVAAASDACNMELRFVLRAGSTLQSFMSFL